MGKKVRNFLNPTEQRNWQVDVVFTYCTDHVVDLWIVNRKRELT